MHIRSRGLVFIFCGLNCFGCGNQNTLSTHSQVTDLSLSLSNSEVSESTENSNGISLLNTDFQTVRRVERYISNQHDTPLTSAPADDLVAIAQRAANDLNPKTQLRLLHLRRGGQFTYATFKQIIGSRDIIGSKIVMRLNSAGDWTSANSTLVNPNLLLDLSPANSKEIDIKNYFSEINRVVSEKSVILPKKNPDGIMKFYSAREMLIQNIIKHNKFFAWFDESTGQILMVHNPTMDADDFKVVGNIQPIGPDDIPISYAFPLITARFGELTKILSGSNGELNGDSFKENPLQIWLENDHFIVYTSSISKNHPPSVDLNCGEPQSLIPPEDLRVANFSIDALDSKRELNLNIGFSPSERNVYHWLMRARDYFTNTLNFSETNFKLSAKTDDTEDPDNATFMPPDISITFGAGEKLFKNLALSRSVIIHEYVHAITQAIYGMPYSFEFNTMNEAFSDYFAASMLDDSQIGRGIMQKSTHLPYLRNIDNKFKFPNDFSGKSFHSDSQIFSAALWDLRKKLGAKITDNLVHEAQLAQPLTIREFMMELLLIDENKDDKNPFTPSKNKKVIADAFFSHGLNSGARFKDKVIDKMMETVQVPKAIELEPEKI